MTTREYPDRNPALINALRRLEAAGSEDSRATGKLHEAARILALAIERIVPEDVELPRGYTVRRIHSNVGSECFLTYVAAGEYGAEDAYVDGCGGYLHGDFRCPIPAQTRETSLAFAQDVAGGWLEELAAFLEARTSEADDAALKLGVAAEALR